MTSKIKTVFAILISLTAPVLAAEYQMPRGAIAQVMVAGGFKPIDAPYATGVRIYENGRVESFSISNQGKTESKLIATLTPARVEAILAESRKLTVVDLIPADPNDPPCADAPDTTYLARNGRRDVVPLKGNFQCINHVRSDGAWSSLPDILHGFVTLSYLK